MSEQIERPPWKPDGADGRVLAFVELPSGAVLRVRTPGDRMDTREIIETVDGEQVIKLLESKDSVAVMQRYNELVDTLAVGEHE